MLEPPNRTEQFAGCYWYTVPETGKRVPQNGNVGLSQLRAMVAEHYRANGYQPPGNLEDTLVEFCCKNSPDVRCHEVKEGRHTDHVHAEPGQRLSLSQIISGTKTLVAVARHLMNGGDYVPEHVSRDRALVCLNCPMHQTVSCSACALKQLATSFITQYKDDRLKACSVCGCWLRAKVMLPWHVVAKHTTNRVWQQYPPECWMVTETPNERTQLDTPSSPA